MRNLLRDSGVGVFALLLITGCASTTDTGGATAVSSASFEAREGRIEFESNAIADQRSSVMTAAIARFGQPRCSAIKTGLTNSRRAAVVEDCVFELPTDKVSYAGTTIDTVSYRFLDGRLLQMNLEFKRSQEFSRNPADGPVNSDKQRNMVISALRLSLSEDLQLSDPYLSQSVSGSGSATQWDAGQDSLVLEGNAASDSATVRIFDQRVTPTVIAAKSSP